MARPLTLPVELGGRDLWLSFVAVRITDGVVYAFRDVTAETRLEEEKTDFVATISHELRTPMTAVYGAAQTLLRRDEISPEQRRQLIEMIATQAARLSQITEEILLTTRLDRDEITVQHEPVDVGAAVESAVQAMRSHLPEDMEMQVEIAADVGRAAGDSDRIQQVLLNLIDNAAKHGRSPVRISAGTSNGLVSIAVSDSGPELRRASASGSSRSSTGRPAAHALVGRHRPGSLHLPRADAQDGWPAPRRVRARGRRDVRG